MKSMLIRALPATAIAAVIAVSASTGAVAAALITGADIKDGSVASRDIKNRSLTGKDVKNGSLTAADINATTLGELEGVSGVEFVVATQDVLSGNHASLSVECPAGKQILGIASDWKGNWEPASERINQNLLGGYAYGENTTGSTQTLRGTATCATVG